MTAYQMTWVNMLDYCQRQNQLINYNLQNVFHFENSAFLLSIGELFRLLKFLSAGLHVPSDSWHIANFFSYLETFFDISLIIKWQINPEQIEKKNDLSVHCGASFKFLLLYSKYRLIIRRQSILDFVTSCASSLQ